MGMARWTRGRGAYPDYVNANNAAISPNPLLYGVMVANRTAFTDRLFNSGSTRFIDGQGRAIIYGTTGSDLLSASQFENNQLIKSQLRDAASSTGVVIVAGGGNDALKGGTNKDILLGEHGLRMDATRYARFVRERA